MIPRVGRAALVQRSGKICTLALPLTNSVRPSRGAADWRRSEHQWLTGDSGQDDDHLHGVSAQHDRRPRQRRRAIPDCPTVQIEIYLKGNISPPLQLDTTSPLLANVVIEAFGGRNGCHRSSTIGVRVRAASPGRPGGR